MYFLGIDVGTGGSRAVLIDANGRIVASATAEHEAFAAPNIGWAEQNAEDWWRASATAVRTILTEGKVDAEKITAVGFSGQMHGAVLLDERGEVLRPAIIWCDQRTTEQCRTITNKIGAEKIIELVSNPALTNFTLPKMLWVREFEPEIWAGVKTVLLPKDYVRFRLTGDRATDVSDASGTLMFDVANRRWSAETLNLLEFDETLLPRVYESIELTGTVSDAGAKATGLIAGTPVVAGAGDNAAGAVGMGIVETGAVSATIGTSGVVFAVTDQPSIDTRGRIHTFCHAIPNRWHVTGVTQGAGLSLGWFRDTFAADESYEKLTEQAARAPAGADGLFWTPYLMGERTPHIDPHARAALVGLTASHTKAHVVRAVLEGVAFSLRDCLEVFRELNVPIESIRLGGGAARSALWRQIQADIYRQTVEVVEAEEGAAFGAALLAGVGVGAWETVEAACGKVVRVADRIEPNLSVVELMNRQYQTYREIYPATKKITAGN